ncbi:trichodiene oxygenase [Ilyonectria sp. MPI-CAGE-AT-0026]|nr:trichodiene oxygenase [Ilyonectria sp. MPI-CAGE-AT-0026]
MNDIPISSGTEVADVKWFGSAWRYPLLLAIIWLLHTATLVVYRLTWHPLASFPGPVLSRASYVYEFWFDVILQGRYTRKISSLHKKYGPIVRINPNELHCNDPSFIDVVYAHGKEKRNKSDHYLAAMPWGLRLASVGTEDHDHHRLRRAPVTKFFSRSQIIKRESIFHEKIQHLCDKLLLYRDRAPFQLAAAYSCFTTDALTSYCFGRSLGNLEQPGWNPSFKGTVDKITGLFYLSRHLHTLARLADVMPLSVCRLISTEISSLLELIRVTIPKLVEQSKGTSDTDTGKKQPTVVETILQSDLPEAEKSPDRLTSEAIAIVLGGTHSISTVLSIATFHLLTNPSQMERLLAELRTVVTDETNLPSWSTLEKLPYLNGVVLEALRLMYGVASRISVIAPDEELLYTPTEGPPGATSNAGTSYTIPRGYAIGVSSYMIHMDPTLFPNASEFIPDRWLDKEGQRDRGLEKYLMSFSKGHRQCIGMQLAYCELYLSVAALALRVMPHMTLHDTTISDIAYDHDQLIAMPKKGSKGVQVAIH